MFIVCHVCIWFAVVFGINNTSNAESNCTRQSAINPKYHSRPCYHLLILDLKSVVYKNQLHTRLSKWMNDKINGYLLCIHEHYKRIHKCYCLVHFRVRVDSDSSFFARLYSTHVTDLSICLRWTAHVPKGDTTIVEHKKRGNVVHARAVH